MVRIKLELKALGTCSQENFSKKFNSAFKGYLYRILEDSKFKLDKENSNFRHFCFSNIFPIRDKKLVEGKIYSIFISSPVPDLILHLLTKIQIDSKLNLGEASFEIISMNIFKDEVFSQTIIESVTPIIIRTNRDKKEEDKQINFENEKELFIKTLNFNLLKKYYGLKGERAKEMKVFENVEIELLKVGSKKKSHFSMIIEDFDEVRKGKPLKVHGNKLRFKIGDISELQKEILQVGFESGFGSMNSYGFGFMHIVRDRK